MVEETTQKETRLEVEPGVVSDEKAAIRAKQRERKRAQRARDRAKREISEAKKNEAKLATMSNAEWWALNTKKDLSAKQQAEMTVRDEEVLELEIAMEDVIFTRLERLAKLDKYVDHSYEYVKLFEELREMNLVDPPTEFTEQHIAVLKVRVLQDVEKHGTRCGGIEGMNFANHRDRFDNWSQGHQGTLAYVLYGFCIALDSGLVGAFLGAISTPGYGMRCQCGATTRVQDQSEVVPRWRCPKCAERDRQQADVNAALDKIRQQAIREPDNIRPFDAFGRPFDGGKP